MFSDIASWFDRPWKVITGITLTFAAGYMLHRWKGPSIDKAIDKVWYTISHPGETFKKFKDGFHKKEGTNGNPQ